MFETIIGGLGADTRNDTWEGVRSKNQVWVQIYHQKWVRDLGNIYSFFSKIYKCDITHLILSPLHLHAVKHTLPVKVQVAAGLP